MALGTRGSQVITDTNTTGLTNQILDSALKELKNGLGDDSPFVRSSGEITQETAGDDFIIKDSSDNDILNVDTSGETVTVSGDLNVEDGSSNNILSVDVSEATVTVGFENVLPTFSTLQTLADDAEITISSGKAGFGICQIGNNQEYSFFSFSTTTPIVLNDSTNVVYTDTDANLCIYYSGADLMIKNRLGSSLELKVTVWNS